MRDSVAGRPGDGPDAHEAELENLFERLSRSSFRRRFMLKGADLEYLQRKGLAEVLEHGRKFISQRLAAAEPANDGKQTPYRGHPIFVAQHATGTCCRGCIAKWHRIPKGRVLSESDRERIVTVMERWLASQLASPEADR